MELVNGFPGETFDFLTDHSVGSDDIVAKIID